MPPRIFQVGTCERYYNNRRRRWCVTLGTGACYVTDEDDVLTTVLGSCIAACVRDPLRGVGGMNHFLLPFVERALPDQAELATRYGVHAMELLVNEVMKAGGRRSDLEVKLFGGASLTARRGDSGRRNIEFAYDYLKTEGLRLVSSDVGDVTPRRLEFHPRSGRARVLRLEAVRVPSLTEQELRFRRDLERAPIDGDVELF